MNDATSGGLPPQPEDYRAILNWICRFNWAAIAVMVAIELLIRISHSELWPQWGNFSLSYNLTLLEFAAVTFGISLLLRNTAWLDRAPREALGRLHWLMIAVLGLDALHFLSFFRSTGGLHGPAAALLPTLLMTLYLLLPRRDANPVVAGLLVLVTLAVLIDGGLGTAQGQLAPAFSAGSAPWLLVFAACIALALLTGFMAREQMENAGVGLIGRLQQDPQTGLFTREVLEKRVTGEIGRVGRSDSGATLLMIGFRNLPELIPHGDFAALNKIMHDFAEVLLRSTRNSADTCARYDAASFAALLPTACGENQARIIERIQQCADAVCQQETGIAKVELAIGVVNISPSNPPDPTGLITAAEQALQEARVAGDGHQVIIRDL